MLRCVRGQPAAARGGMAPGPAAGRAPGTASSELTNKTTQVQPTANSSERDRESLALSSGKQAPRAVPCCDWRWAATRPRPPPRPPAPALATPKYLKFLLALSHDRVFTEPPRWKCLFIFHEHIFAERFNRLSCRFARCPVDLSVNT